jgi:hypothetical protein
MADEIILLYPFIALGQVDPPKNFDKYVTMYICTAHSASIAYGAHDYNQSRKQ